MTAGPDWPVPGASRLIASGIGCTRRSGARPGSKSPLRMCSRRAASSELANGVADTRSSRSAVARAPSSVASPRKLIRSVPAGRGQEPNQWAPIPPTLLAREAAGKASALASLCRAEQEQAGVGQNRAVTLRAVSQQALLGRGNAVRILRWTLRCHFARARAQGGPRWYSRGHPVAATPPGHLDEGHARPAVIADQAGVGGNRLAHSRR